MFGILCLTCLTACSAQTNFSRSANAISASQQTATPLEVDESVLAVSFVAAAESTATSLGAIADLPTPDIVNFYLPSATTVFVNYTSMMATYENGTGQNVLFVDGQNLTQSTITFGAGIQNPSELSYSVALAAGPHTINIQHAATDACGGGCNFAFWQSRMLVVRALGGSFFAANSVNTSQAVSSNSFVDLATPDQINFSLSNPSSVLVEYMGTETSVVNQGTSQFLLDGSPNASIPTTSTFQNSSVGYLNALFTVQDFTAGNHTIDVQHEVATNWNNSVNWYDRSIKLTRLPSPTMSVVYIPTAEATNSATPVDLATPETITFQVPATTNVLIEYRSMALCDTGYQVSSNTISVDGVALTTMGTTSIGWAQPSIAGGEISVEAGTHTVTVQHSTSEGNPPDPLPNCTWSSRLLKATVVN